MTQITISDFRQNLKKYAEIVKHEDIIVVSNGKPVMRISDPARNRVDEIKKLHPTLAMCKLVGWDIAIDNSETPVVVEINLSDIGMTDKSQALNGPLFGEDTDDVLEEVFLRKKEK